MALDALDRRPSRPLYRLYNERSTIKEMSEALAVPAIEHEPWQRLQNETPQAWHAFNVYRNLPPPRTIIGAARNYAESTKRNERTVHSQFQGWSRRFDWQGRADAFDLVLDRRRIEARETERQRIDREQMLEGRFLRQSAVARFTGRDAAPGVQPVTPIDWNDLDLSEVLAAYRLGRDTERQAAGLQIGAAMGMIPISHARQIVDEVFDLAIEHIPEERRASFVAKVHSLAERR